MRRKEDRNKSKKKIKRRKVKRRKISLGRIFMIGSCYCKIDDLNDWLISLQKYLFSHKCVNVFYLARKKVANKAH